MHINLVDGQMSTFPSAFSFKIIVGHKFNV